MNTPLWFLVVFTVGCAGHPPVRDETKSTGLSDARIVKSSLRPVAEPAAIADSTPTWQPLYEVPEGVGSFGFLSMFGDRWFAPGKNFILEGGEQDNDVVRHELPGQFFQRVGMLPGSKMVAVGDPFAIWERLPTGWKQWPPKGPKPSGRFSDVLAYVEELREGEQTYSVAHGPVALVRKSAKGDWKFLSRKEKQRLMNLARHGPKDALECAPTLWRWFGQAHGWYLCDDGRSFFFDGERNRALPAVPPECAQDAGASNVTASGVSFVCDGAVMLLHQEATAWRKIPGPDELFSVALGAKCALANSKQTVWRLCF